MAKKEPSNTAKPAATAPQSRSKPIAARGLIADSRQFAEFMSALMSDVVSQAVSPDIVNAACNAGGKLLKVVEMQHKYGQPTATGERTLRLVQAG